MRADLPLCNFKNCKYQFDGNCTVKERHDKCDYIRLHQKCVDIHHIAHNMMNMLEQIYTIVPN